MAEALTPRRPWKGRRVVLGVTGGIAAYKAVQVARDLTQLGAAVDVVLTRSAESFVGPVTFEALTGRPVHRELVAAGHALEHIRLAREADVVCVAPATADLMARAAHGRSDDLITAILLATRAPVLLCPAMNDRMWDHSQTQRNASHLRDACGYELVGPAVGPLAFGEGAGAGRMEEPAVIVEHVGRALERGSALRGRTVVVTAGPTREAVDPVRVLSNRSSGRMGFALAQAAWRRGAEVVLIAGPTSIAPPTGPRLVRIETAEELLRAVRETLPKADALIMAAAVADFRPAGTAAQKIKKADAPSAIELEAAPDILRSTREARPERMVAVGFALETEKAREHARGKLESKGLDLVVLNELGEPGVGFEVETNRVVILDPEGGAQELPLMSKHDVAEAILDRVEPLIVERS